MSWILWLFVVKVVGAIIALVIAGTILTVIYMELESRQARLDAQRMAEKRWMVLDVGTEKKRGREMFAIECVATDATAANRYLHTIRFMMHRRDFERLRPNDVFGLKYDQERCHGPVAEPGSYLFVAKYVG